MAHGRMWLTQEAQRDPASEELGLDIGVAGDKPMLGGDLIGRARLSVIQRAAAIDAPLGPPIVEVEQDIRLARRIEQHLPGLLSAVLVLGAAEPLDPIEAQANIGLDRARRQRIEQLAGIAAPLHDRDAGRDLLLLVGGQQLGHAQRRLGCGRIVRIEQPVDARAMNVRGEHVAVTIEDLLLDRGIELMIAPSRNHQRLRAGLVAVLDIDAGKRRLTRSGQRRRILEECPDLVRTCVGQEQNRLGLLAQFVLPRPVRMCKPEGFDGFGVA